MRRALLALFLALGPLLFTSAEAGGVECRLADDGTITTWLLTPPLSLDLKAGFAKDLLPDKMGETSGAERAEGTSPILWRAEAFPAAHLDLSKRCLNPAAPGTRTESVFYAACELRALKAGTYTLTAIFWSQVSAWLDGKPVLEGTAGELLIPRKTAEVKLDAGRSHHLLIKLGSKQQQALLRVALTAPGQNDIGEQPAPVVCILRTPDGRAGELLAQSLSLVAGDGPLVGSNKPVAMRAEVQAGCPLLKGEIQLTGAVLDTDGRTIHELKSAKLDAKDIPGSALQLPWAVPDGAKAYRYTARVDVVHAGKKVGELSRTFYVAEGLSEWAKSLAKRLQDLELQLGQRQYTEPDFALARLKLEKATLYAHANGQLAFSAEKLVDEMDGSDAALARLEKHQRRPDAPGLSEHAYISPIDDGAQPYYVFVPKKHDGRTRLPCIVYLHGYNPDLDKTNWEMIPRELLAYCDQHGFYLVAPFARSNTDFQSVGEVDVLHALHLMGTQYPVDADRIFLLGYSMGAMGVFTVGAHYPDLWAGLVSVAGRTDYYLWKNLDREKVEPYKRLLIDLEFGAAMPANYRNLPVLMYHGGADTLIEVEQSRNLLKTLKSLGADVTYHELPGQDHWIMPDVLTDDAVFKWMLARKRNRWPGEVDFTSRSIRYRQAYWCSVLEAVRWGEAVRVHAKLNPEKTVLDVKAQNVATLQLELSEELIGKAPRLAVRINGREQLVEKTGAATFEIEPVNKAGKLRKTPRLCGPVKEAYCRRFLIVARADPADNDADRLMGDRRRAASEWYLFTKSLPLIKSDADVTAADIASSNLILYGTPATNAKLKEIADKLPVKITDDAFEFQGRKYPTKDHGLVMTCPNPLNPERYVVVRAGLPYGGTLSVNHKLDLLPDFVIFKDGADYDDTDKAVVAGFFDENWQVAERLIWRRADADPDPRLRKPEPPLLPDKP